MSSQSLSSNRILRTTLLWSAGVTAVLAIAGAVIGYAVAGMPGLWSALIAIVLAAVFLSLTGVTILVANRWYGDPLFVPIFFGAVMGGWLLKFVLFLVALFVLRGQEWLHPTVFVIALIAGVVAALAIDVTVMLRMRVPHVSDTTLPTAADIDDPTDDEAGPEVISGPES
ncbi:hypothetical protein ACQ143_12095 [Microbacterium sp. MC2]